MEDCSRTKGTIVVDYSEMFISLWILHNEHVKIEGFPIVYDAESFSNELLKYIDNPLHLDEILNELESEKHINVFQPTSLTNHKKIITLDPLHAYEITQYKESEKYKQWFSKAEEMAGRKITEDNFFSADYSGFKQLILYVAYEFFVSFIPEIRDYDGLKRYRVTTIDS